MADLAQLQVTFAADTASLQTALDQARTELDSFKTSAAETTQVQFTGETAGLTAASDEAKGQLEGFKTTAAEGSTVQFRGETAGLSAAVDEGRGQLTSFKETAAGLDTVQFRGETAGLTAAVDEGKAQLEGFKTTAAEGATVEFRGSDQNLVAAIDQAKGQIEGFKTTATEGATVNFMGDAAPLDEKIAQAEAALKQYQAEADALGKTTLTLDAAGFDSGVGEAKSETSQLASELAVAEGAGYRFDEAMKSGGGSAKDSAAAFDAAAASGAGVSGALADAGAKSEEAEGKTRALGAAFDFAFDAAATFAGVTGILAVVQGLGGIVTAAQDSAAAMGQGQRVMQAMGYSADEAKSHLEQLRGLAEEGGLDFPAIEKADQHLVSMGVSADKTVPILHNAAQAAVAMGTGAEGVNQVTAALGRMEETGQVSSRTMTTLVHSGVDIWHGLATVLGTDVQGAMQAVKDKTVDVDTVMKAFETQTASQFGDQLSAGAKTMSGSLTRLKENLSEVIAAGIGPFKSGVAEAVGAMADFVARADVHAVLDALGAALKGAATAAVDLIRGGLQLIGPALSGIVSLAASAVGPVVSLAQQFSGPLKIGLEAAALAIVVSLTPAIWGAVAAITAFTTEAVIDATIVAAPFVAIGVAVAGLVIAYEKIPGVSEAVNSALSATGSLLSSVGSSIASFWTGSVQPYLVEGWNTVAPAASSALSSVGSAASSGLSSAGSAISSFWTGTVQPYLVQGWNAVAPAASSALSTVGSAVGSGLSSAGSAISSFWTNTAEPYLIQGWNTVSAAVGPALSTLGSILSSVFSVAGSVISAFWTGIVQPYLIAQWGTVSAAVSAALPILATIFQTTFDVIRSVVTTVWPLFTQALSDGGSMVSEFVSEAGPPLIDMFNAVAPVVERMASLIAGDATAAWGVLKPALEEIYNIVSPLLTPALEAIAVVIGFGLVSPILILVGSLATLAFAFIGIVEGLKLLGQGLDAAQTVLNNFADGIHNWVIGAFDTAKSYLASWGADIMSILNGIPIVKFFVGIYNELVGQSIIPDLVNAIVSWFGRLASLLTAPLNAVVTVVTSIWTTISTAVSTAVSGIQSAVSTAWNWVSSTTTSIYDGIASYLGGWWSTLESTFNTALTAVENALSTAWNWVSSTTTSVYDTVASYLSSWWSTLESTFSTALTAVENALSTAWNWVSSTTTSVYDAIASYLTSWWSTLESTFDSAVSTVESGISAGWNWISSTTTSVYDSIASFLSGWWDTLTSTFNTAVSGLESMLSSAWSTIASGAETGWGIIRDNIVNPIIEAYDKVVDVIDAIIEAIAGVLKGIAPNTAATLQGLEPTKINSFATGGGQEGSSAGDGTINSFATGGVSSQTPGYTTSRMVEWGEDLPSGSREYFLTEKPDYKARNFELWQEYGSRMGFVPREIVNQDSPMTSVPWAQAQQAPTSAPTTQSFATGGFTWQDILTGNPATDLHNRASGAGSSASPNLSFSSPGSTNNAPSADFSQTNNTTNIFNSVMINGQQQASGGGSPSGASTTSGATGSGGGGGASGGGAAGLLNITMPAAMWQAMQQDDQQQNAAALAQDFDPSKVQMTGSGAAATPSGGSPSSAGGGSASPTPSPGGGSSLGSSAPSPTLSATATPTNPTATATAGGVQAQSFAPLIQQAAAASSAPTPAPASQPTTSPTGSASDTAAPSTSPDTSGVPAAVSDMQSRGEQAIGSGYNYGSIGIYAGPDGYSCSGLWDWIVYGETGDLSSGGTYDWDAGMPGWSPGAGNVEVGVTIGGGQGPDDTHMSGDIYGTVYESDAYDGVSHGAFMGGAANFPDVWHMEGYAQGGIAGLLDKWRNPGMGGDSQIQNYVQQRFNQQLSANLGGGSGSASGGAAGSGTSSASPSGTGSPASSAGTSPSSGSASGASSASSNVSLSVPQDVWAQMVSDDQSGDSAKLLSDFDPSQFQQSTPSGGGGSASGGTTSPVGSAGLGSGGGGTTVSTGKSNVVDSQLNQSFNQIFKNPTQPIMQMARGGMRGGGPNLTFTSPNLTNNAPSADFSNSGDNMNNTFQSVMMNGQQMLYSSSSTPASSAGGGSNSNVQSTVSNSSGGGGRTVGGVTAVPVSGPGSSGGSVTDSSASPSSDGFYSNVVSSDYSQSYNTVYVDPTQPIVQMARGGIRMMSFDSGGAYDPAASGYYKDPNATGGYYDNDGNWIALPASSYDDPETMAADQAGMDASPNDNAWYYPSAYYNYYSGSQDVSQGVWPTDDTIEGPLDTVERGAQDTYDYISGAASTVAGWLGFRRGGIRVPRFSFASGGSLTDAQIQAGLDAGGAAVGDNYVAGGVGPPGDGFDCSGLWNWIESGIAYGSPVAERRWGTTDMPAPGWDSGTGQVSVGVGLSGWGGPDGTHMAGNVTGTGFEADEVHGVSNGGISGADPMAFDNQYFLGDTTYVGTQTSGGGGMRSIISGLLKGAMSTAVDPLFSGTWPGGVLGQGLQEYMKNTIPSDVTNWVMGQVPGGGGGTSGSGSSSSGASLPPEADGWITQGLADTGEPASWAPDIEWIMNHESGGQNISNLEGSGATGPMQLMPDTFNAYQVVGHPDINNPQDNVDAALNYIESRYGSPDSIGGVGSDNWPGYASGGIITKPQLAWLGEGGSPEAVVPLDDPSKMANFVNTFAPPSSAGLSNSYAPPVGGGSGAGGVDPATLAQAVEDGLKSHTDAVTGAIKDNTNMDISNVDDLAKAMIVGAHSYATSDLGKKTMDNNLSAGLNQFAQYLPASQ